MRKGYGPTGVSFGYHFADFKEDVTTGNIAATELVIGGNCFNVNLVDSLFTESEMQAVYDKADSLEIRSVGRTLIIFA